MKLSIVSTLYRSDASLADFYRRAGKAAHDFAGDDYEIVLANDGSPDRSLDMAVGFSETDPHLVVVDLSRNFGHHRAMMTGLLHAKGDFVYLLDSDLEEEPEWLSEFAKRMQAESADVVYGVQKRRKGGFMERWTGALFYLMFRLLTGVALPKNAVTARLMTRRYVDALVKHEEREVFMAGLWYITGFEQRPCAVTKHKAPRTTYSLFRRMSLVVNSITSFSNAPLRAIFFLGILISMIAGASVAYLVFKWLFLSRPLSGWTSVIASIWLIGGLIISFIGVVGIYLSKVYSEVKRRPYTIVRRVYGRDQAESRGASPPPP
jgi:putative glycosyltransferase